MPRRRKRPPIPVHLSLPAEPPTLAEIDAILMATDSVIGSAGRAGVTLILNGSRSQKALRQEWDQLPEYGALKHLTAATRVFLHIPPKRYIPTLSNRALRALSE